MDRKKLEDLIRLVEDSDIQELEIRGLLGSVRIARPTGHFVPAEQHRGETPETVHAASEREVSVETQPEETDRNSGLVPIVSPMVGTFYASSAPGSAPYVRQGDRVNKQQVVCIVEAMKIMNEIESDVSGTVVRVLAENAQPVEYGQELFLVQPD